MDINSKEYKAQVDAAHQLTLDLLDYLEQHHVSPSHAIVAMCDVIAIAISRSNATSAAAAAQGQAALRLLTTNIKTAILICAEEERSGK